MAVGDINSVPETACGFRFKLIYFLERIEALRRSLGKEKSEMRVLDIGCGNGLQMTIPLAYQGYDVTGIDMHEPSIEHARANNIFKNARFVQHDVFGFNEVCGGLKFDVIVFSDILEHIQNPLKLLETARQILHEQGIILISIPNGYGPFEIENFILRKLGIIRFGRFLRNLFSQHLRLKVMPYNVESGHVQFFTMKKMLELFNNAGFKVTQFKKGSFLAGPISNMVISRSNFLMRYNLALTKYLPHNLCSVWYFECALK